MSNSDFGPGVIVGVLLGGLLFSGIWVAATANECLVYNAIKRRGYDVEALAKETEVTYWKSIASGRVCDPQPVKETP